MATKKLLEAVDGCSMLLRNVGDRNVLELNHGSCS